MLPNEKKMMKDDAISFCQTCRYAYECWVIHMHLFADLPSHINLPEEEFLGTGYGQCLNHLNEISSAYFRLQIAKLHDPDKGGRNLSISYFCRQRVWSPGETKKISEITPTLERMYKKIKPARDRILAHNDRDTFVDDIAQGDFPNGWDVEYFKKLGEFSDLVWTKWVRDTEIQYHNRDFDFSLCPPDDDAEWPANQAKQLRDLIIRAIPK